MHALVSIMVRGRWEGGPGSPASIRVRGVPGEMGEMPLQLCIHAGLGRARGWEDCCHGPASMRVRSKWDGRDASTGLNLCKFGVICGMEGMSSQPWFHAGQGVMAACASQ